MHILGQSEAVYTATTSSLVFSIPFTMGPAILLGFSITLFFFRLFIMFIVWLIHINQPKLPFHIKIGEPKQILAIYGNILY